MQAKVKRKIFISADILVIVGGGDVDIKLLKSFDKKGIMIIAADGGANICAKANVIPKAIIGDMDSIKNQRQWESKTRLIKIDEQETSDFEKCLYCSDAPIIIALGMSGNRFDHMLASIDIVTRYAKDRSIILVDKKSIALSIIGEFSFFAERGERISIFPLGKIEFEHSTGLLFPLNDVTLKLGIKSGVSNSAIGGDIFIKPKKDEKSGWMLILKLKYLNELIKRLAQLH